MEVPKLVNIVCVMHLMNVFPALPSQQRSCQEHAEEESRTSADCEFLFCVIFCLPCKHIKRNSPICCSQFIIDLEPLIWD